jgi:hypothetical protein
MPHIRIRVLIAFLALSPAIVLAQAALTSVRGTVVDLSGATVVGAQVVVTQLDTGMSRAETSGAQGEYQFLQLTPGTYTVTVTAEGFGQQAKRAEFLVSQPATLNFTLSVEKLSTTVDVSAEDTTMNTTDASIGNSVGNEAIQALPMEGRNVPDLLSLQPGVLYLGYTHNQVSDSRSGAVAGGRSDQGNITLDGIDNNDQATGKAFTGVMRSTLDSVEEFRVTTTNANADAGRSSGAQVNMVTRGGTNIFHGSLYEYNRNTVFAANDWFNKQAEIEQGFANKPGKLIRNTFGGTVGGPIRKDKFFFFANYERQPTAENVQQTQTVPNTPATAGNLNTAMSAGNISYPHTVNGATTTVTLNKQQIATMDPNCTANGTCPLGPGVDPAILSLLNLFPAPNGNVSGDGYNTASYTWSAPDPGTLNTSIVKLDWDPSERHRLFVRGNLQDDTADSAPQFPGQPYSLVQRTNTKGIAAGDIWTISNTLINNVRYGYTRESYSDRGTGSGPYVTFVGLSNIYAETRNALVSVPVHNVVDDLTWTHRNHTFQFGVNYRLLHNNDSTDSNSYNSAAGTQGWLGNFGTMGSSFDPSGFGYPSVDPTFQLSYDNSMLVLAGLISYVTNQYNYQINGGGATGSLLPQGQFINYDFKNNEFEYYAEDSWRVKSNLTITLGLRHTLLQTPYEVNGQQVTPSIDMDSWYLTRASQAAKGVSDQPFYSFTPGGQARGGAPYWPMQKTNLAPRFAVAYSPNPSNGFMHAIFGDAGKSSIRAGFGLYFDHFGQGIVSSFSQFGAFGLSGSTAVDGFTADNAPRYSTLQTIPDIVPPSSTVKYPFQPSTTGNAFGWGIDNHVKSPYSYAMNFSIQRELPKGFLLETSYVGRMGRHLMQQLDFAEFLDLVDPKSGMDYYTAASALSKAGFAGQASVSPIAYWEDMFPDAAGLDAVGDGAPGNSATQNIYNDLWKGNPLNSTLNIYYMDVFCDPGCGNGQTGRYVDQQFNSLYGWGSIGTSSYNAGQVTLRHALSHGAQIDVNYTFSKSIDLNSDAERQCVQCSGSGLGITSFGYIINTFKPRLNRGVSDFDTTHLLTADWVYQLPFGKGRAYLNQGGHVLNSIVGGWQFSGLTRWTSGLPFSLLAGNGWQTNVSTESALVRTGPVALHKHLVNGAPEVFANPDALISGLASGYPLRNPLPGEAGERNNFRGDGFFGIDSGLTKDWAIHEQHQLKFAWEVFNVTNSVRFDVNPLTSLQNQTNIGELGVYGKTLSLPRVQQFSLRYSF